MYIIFIYMFINKNLNNNTYYFKLYKIQQNEFDQFIFNFNLLFKKKVKIKIIFDLSDVIIKDFLFTKQLLKFMKENKKKTEKYIDKTSIIISNEFIRKNINFCIFNFYKPIKPNKITNTLENALYFINE
mgnify:CR=1 FL=1